jgi:tape measure domain-containing protein
MADYGALTIAVQANTRALERSIATQAVRAGDSAGQTFGNRFTSSVGGVLKGIGKTAAFAGVAGIGYGIAKSITFAKGAVVDFNSTLQQTQIGYTTMLGSGKKAQKFIDELKAFAAKTPFEFEGLTKNAQTMLGMGISAKDVLPDLKALGDSVASVGGTTDTLNNTILAFSQMSARGKVDMGNLNQLLQGGVPNALRILASRFHTSTQNMMQMISQGKVMSKDAIPALVKGIEKGTDSTAALGGMMDKQSKTFQGALSNIHDVLTQALAGIGKPLFDKLSDLANQLATFLASPQFTKIARAATQIFGGWMTKLEPIIKQAWPTIKSVLGQLSGRVSGLFAQLAPLGKTVGQVLGDVMHALGPVLAQVAQSFKVLMANLGPVIAKAAPILADLANLLGELLVKALKAITPLFKPVATFLKLAIGLVGDLVPALTPLINTVMDFAATLIKALAPVLKVIIDALKQLLPPILAIVKVVADELVGIFKALTPILVPLGKLIAQLASQYLGELVDILNVLTPIIEFAAKLLGGVLKAAIKVLTPVLRVLINILTWWSRVVTNLAKWIGDKLVGALKLFSRIAKNVWETVRRVIKWSWDHVIKPVWDRFYDAIHEVGDAFKWFWYKVIKPVWGWIKSAFNVGWSAVKKIFGWFGKAIDNLGDLFTDFKGLIRDAWSWIGDKITWVWQHVIKPVFDAFKKIPGAIVNAFRGLGRILGNVMDNVVKAVGQPVWEIADKILKPLLSGLNWLLSKVGIGTINTDWIGAIPHFATGGRVPGGWGGGDKVIAAVEPGEWVLTKTQARAIGYGTLAGLPKHGHDGSALPHYGYEPLARRVVPHYAEGGLVHGILDVIKQDQHYNWHGIELERSHSWLGDAFGAIGHTFTGAIEGAWHLGQDVVESGTHLFRWVAGEAFEAMAAPLKAAAQHWAESDQMMPAMLGKWAVKTIDAIVDWVKGHSAEQGTGLAGAAGKAAAMALKVVQVALAQINKPYVFGRHGPDAFDCSGLAEYSYRMAGYPNGKIPGPYGAIGTYTGNEVTHGWPVNGPALPADLVFYTSPGAGAPHHVAIVTDPPKVISAADEQIGIIMSTINSAGNSGDSHQVRRYIKPEVTPTVGGILEAAGQGPAQQIWSQL